MSNQEMILGGGFSTVLPFSATGGTITTSGAYTIHTFTGSGTFGVTNAPIGFSVDYLVVAGGGSGYYGGGGAGGMRTGSLSLAAGSYTVTVGAGGNGANGSNSVFSTVTSTGGGRGNFTGSSGGSGGGSATRSVFGGSNIAGQGNKGGANFTGPLGNDETGGGGGGAGASGGDGSGNNSYAYAGNGGQGLQSSIKGTSAFYAGGGGGGTVSPGEAGVGGAGGGGNGFTRNIYGNATPGGINTGGGGGGDKAGGSGIVIIRYLTPS